MTHAHMPATAATGQPIHLMLAQFPVVCFNLTLLTDIIYWRTSNLMWQEFSSWLLLAGLLFGALALIVGMIEYFFRTSAPAPGPAWPYVAGAVTVLGLAFLNSLVHAGDGWTAVVPWGLVLSFATVIMVVITEWLGRTPMYRYGAGVRRHD